MRLVSFDFATGPEMVGTSVLLESPVSARVRSKRPGTVPTGLVVYTVPLSVDVPAGMPCSEHVSGKVFYTPPIITVANVWM